ARAGLRTRPAAPATGARDASAWIYPEQDITPHLAWSRAAARADRGRRPAPRRGVCRIRRGAARAEDEEMRRAPARDAHGGAVYSIAEWWACRGFPDAPGAVSQEGVMPPESAGSVRSAASRQSALTDRRDSE